MFSEEGIRTSKTVNNVKTTFLLDGYNVIEQTDGTTTLHFFYDSKDEVIGFRYNGNDYFYVKNAMSDIIAITDINKNIVAEYRYDPWGKVLDEENLTAIGNLNPFRYRSYYYDSDIEMYYLQSRYYDAEVGRFINCDDVNYIGVTELELSYNPFAYCENNVVNNVDRLGLRAYYIFSSKKKMKEIAVKIVDKTKWNKPNILCSYTYWYDFTEGRKYGVFRNYYTTYTRYTNDRQVERFLFKTYTDWLMLIDLDNCNFIKKRKKEIRKKLGIDSEEMNELVDFILEHTGDDINTILEASWNLPVSKISFIIDVAELLIDIYYKHLSKRTKYISRILDEISKKYQSNKYVIFIPLEITYQYSYSFSSTKWYQYKVKKYY